TFGLNSPGAQPSADNPHPPGRVYLRNSPRPGHGEKELHVGPFRSRAVLLLCLLAPACCLPLSAPAAPPPSQEDIARWVDQLGDKRFANREQASKQLWAAGQAAEPALGKALQSTDAEVRRRARDILDKFKYGIYPDT